MERKSLTIEIKNADQGLVEAVFSKYDEVDYEGDLTLPGAFNDGAEVPIGAYAHGSVVTGGRPPVGKGLIKVAGPEVRLVGGYFMDQPAAVEEFKTVKNLGKLLGWSYGYDILERGTLSDEQKAKGARRALAKLHVHEVSSTVIPAGRSTGTLGTKALDEPPMLPLALVKELCPPCAEQMEKMGVAALRFKAFDNMPPAMFQGLCDKFAPGEGFVTRCMDSSLGGYAAEVTDMGAFCAQLERECGLASRRLAEQKAKEEAAAAKAAERAAADREFERLQRTQRRLGL